MPPFLRPPGVRSEKDLQSRCISCGRCVAVCNYACLELTPDYFFFGGGTPKIFQRKSPCFLCMKCVAVCPTEALRPVPMTEAGMGLARIDKAKCVDYQRNAGVMCWTCYERCPLKGKAIILKNGYLPEITEHCVGCGVCEYVCPVTVVQVTPARHLPGSCA
ncbi:MAG: 4Fe-4S dicluster domain-containing protein [Desulfovibrio sp.]|jgi:NAD-dependent dihydropyrimidine dehydrogenase PreA subunit|nr:4Fe-4S dicluster domain-containing protein [Desulfovibrio sp.]